MGQVKILHVKVTNNMKIHINNLKNCNIKLKQYFEDIGKLALL